VDQNQTFANYGIYLATCVMCHQKYVNQTVNKLSLKWSAHRGTWNKPDKRDGSVQMVPSRHYTVFHGITNKPPIY